jgi:hypothetical protein
VQNLNELNGKFESIRKALEELHTIHEDQCRANINFYKNENSNVISSLKAIYTVHEEQYNDNMAFLSEIQNNFINYLLQRDLQKDLQEQVKVMLGDFLEKVVDERLKLVLTDTLKKNFEEQINNISQKSLQQDHTLANNIVSSNNSSICVNSNDNNKNDARLSIDNLTIGFDVNSGSDQYSKEKDNGNLTSEHNNHEINVIPQEFAEDIKKFMPDYQAEKLPLEYERVDVAGEYAQTLVTKGSLAYIKDNETNIYLEENAGARSTYEAYRIKNYVEPYYFLVPKKSFLSNASENRIICSAMPVFFNMNGKYYLKDSQLVWPAIVKKENDKFVLYKNYKGKIIVD